VYTNFKVTKNILSEKKQAKKIIFFEISMGKFKKKYKKQA
jgi:hypothetical protein